LPHMSGGKLLVLSVAEATSSVSSRRVNSCTRSRSSARSLVDGGSKPLGCLDEALRRCWWRQRDGGAALECAVADARPMPNGRRGPAPLGRVARDSARDIVELDMLAWVDLKGVTTEREEEKRNWVSSELAGKGIMGWGWGLRLERVC
jgi:hypothetical protein